MYDKLGIVVCIVFAVSGTVHRCYIPGSLDEYLHCEDGYRCCHKVTHCCKLEAEADTTATMVVIVLLLTTCSIFIILVKVYCCNGNIGDHNQTDQSVILKGSLANRKVWFASSGRLETNIESK